jgi:hypothetical protein
MSREPAFEAELLNELRHDQPEPPPEVLQRLAERLALGVAVSPGPSEQPGADASAPASALGAKTLLAIGFILGTGAGVAGHALSADVAERVVHRDRIVEVRVPAESAPAPAVATQAEPQLLPEQPKRDRARAQASAAGNVPEPELPPALPEDSLSGELAELDRARKALAAGDARQALGALVAHVGRYPASRLEQEREALTIKALIAVGRTDEARRRGATFLRVYPQSMLADSVTNALKSIP